MLLDQGLKVSETLQSGALKVTLLGEKTRYSLRIKVKDINLFRKSSGLNLPRKIGVSTHTKTHTIFCLGPDEWLVITDVKIGIQTRKMLEKIVAELDYSHTDISHRNIGLLLSGPKAANAINIGCPLDLSLARFPVGKVTRTVFENAPIMLYRIGATEFHLETWRSFGPYICGFFDRYFVDLR